MIENLIIKTNEIHSEYIGEDGGFKSVPIELEKIQKIIAVKTKLEIVYQKRDWENRRILARLLRYKDKAIIETICGEGELNPCWLRFVRCKELCHLILDDEDSYTDNPEQLVHELLEIGIVISPSKAALSETLAVIAAIELLFPLAIRSQFKEMIRNEGFSVYKVAKILRIPESYVEKAISEPYEAHIDSVHRKLIADSKVER